ncbi:MAG: STAS domain-containing protein [Bacteroidetes bacterium]|nr:STAS domain-containing protein [Bacteroidota bacterium]
MKLSTTTQNEITILFFEDRSSDLEKVEKFKSTIKDLIDNGKTKIILDFSSVDFVDSSFLGGLVVMQKRVLSVHGDIKIVKLKPAVRLVFELTRLYKVFEILDTQEDALHSFNLV